MRTFLLGLLLATAASAQPSPADSALVDRFIAANDFTEVRTQLDRMREQVAATAPSPDAAAMLGEIFDMDFDVLRDSIRAELLRDVRPDLLREATAFLEGPVLPRLTAAASDVSDLAPMALTALAQDPGDRPLADSTLAARYGRAILAANQPEDVQTMVLAAMVELFPPALREQIDALGGPQAFAEMSRQAAGGEDAIAAMMTGISRVVLAEVDPDDIRAVTAYYESEAGLYVSHTAARASTAAILPRMVEAMRPMFGALGGAMDELAEPPTRSVADGEILEAAEVQPMLIGGMEALQRRVVYPESARREGVQGQVVIEFVVDEEGRVVDPDVLRSPAPVLARAALAAVRGSRFTPGSQDGLPVKVRFAVPITFRLADPEPSALSTTSEASDDLDRLVQPQLIGGLAALQGRVVYPVDARRGGIQGQVIVEFVVDEQGGVLDPVAVRSPHPLLSAAAIEAVRQSQFVPGSLDGQPVKVQFAVPVTFRLR
ncbi:TonB family protein [Rubrivirga sp. IMCC43871]|uniref:TonB family protein n=1 Tax=Rubrivirga sp. IMCC43871 TaxID=3391575 RepID=UPI00398F9A5A